MAQIMKKAANNITTTQNYKGGQLLKDALDKILN